MDQWIAIYENPSKDLDLRSKKLRQANFKQQYKQRQQEAMEGEDLDLEPQE
jgi:hypothetical protein